MPSPKRDAGKEKAMSNPTELEKLWQKLSEGDYDYVPLIYIQNAIAAEKQRVCENCKYSYVAITNDLIAGEDCYAENTDYPKVLESQGTCHLFTPRGEQK